jgi:hypothetical protein
VHDIDQTLRADCSCAIPLLLGGVATVSGCRDRGASARKPLRRSGNGRQPEVGPVAVQADMAVLATMSAIAPPSIHHLARPRRRRVYAPLDASKSIFASDWSLSVTAPPPSPH